MVKGWKTHSNKKKIGSKSTLFEWQLRSRKHTQKRRKIRLENILSRLMIVGWIMHSNEKDKDMVGESIIKVTSWEMEKHTQIRRR